MEEKNKKQKVALARFAHSRRRRHADASDVCAAAQHIFLSLVFCERKCKCDTPCTPTVAYASGARRTTARAHREQSHEHTNMHALATRP